MTNNLCKCGHSKENHPYIECEICECHSFINNKVDMNYEDHYADLRDFIDKLNSEVKE